MHRNKPVFGFVVLLVFVGGASFVSSIEGVSGATDLAEPATAPAPQAKGSISISNVTPPGDWCRYPQPKAARPAPAQGGVAAIGVGEIEPNDTPAEAQLLPLGTGAGLDRDVQVNGNISSNLDIDYFRFAAAKGDIVGMAAIGGNNPDTVLTISDLADALIIENDDHGGLASIYPAGSPFFGGNTGLDSALTWIVPEDGEYLIKLRSFNSASQGSYTLWIRSRRPRFESEPIPSAQVIFLDFDGADLNVFDTFGFGPTLATLSPLSSFLSKWGLQATDEDAVIDAIIAAVAEKLDDLRLAGLNGDRDSDSTAGHFDYELRNSRDDPDSFGLRNVSRVIIGGTVDEFGLVTIGLAESIDPGNFGGEETAVVLLDFLSEPSPNPNSINSIPRDPSVSIIDAIGLVVGSIVDHEIGHYLGNWHTDNQNGVHCIMDAGGFIQENIAGVGEDGVLGTADDADPGFVEDTYILGENVALGSERTDVRMAFGFSTGTACPSRFHFEDFENGLGGYVIDDGGPTGNGLWHLTTTCESATGLHSTPSSLYYGSDGACDYDAGVSFGTVTSPPIDLSAASGTVELSFRYLLETEGNPENFDQVFVARSRNGGPFILVASNLVGIGSSLTDPTSGWADVAIDLSDVAGSQIQLQWSFFTVDANSNGFRGFYVDDVSLCADSTCQPPLEPSIPGPPDGAVDQPTDVLLTWEGGVQEPIVITFDELPLGTPVDGAVIEPVTFGFALGDATITMTGPGETEFIAPPNMEGDSAGTVAIEFSAPVFAVSYAFAMNTSEPAANATTITLFDQDGLALIAVSADAVPGEFFPAEGQNIASTNVGASSATITFDHPAAQRFVLDNLAISPLPMANASTAPARTLLATDGRKRPVGAAQAAQPGSSLWPKAPAPHVIEPEGFACGTEHPNEHFKRFRAEVDAGLIPDPAKKVLPKVAPRTQFGPAGKAIAGGPTVPVVTADDIFLFEDTADILATTDFTDGELFGLMADATNQVLAAHGDNFDFVGFFLNFDAHHQIGAAFYLGIENDVEGIGLSPFNFRSSLGVSGDQVEGWVMMWNQASWSDASLSFTQLVLGQEFEHRFGLFLEPLSGGRALQGNNGTCGRAAHWSFKADGQGSGMEIPEWVGENPTTRQGGILNYNTDIVHSVYSYPDLYLMGYVSGPEMDSGASELRYLDDNLACQSTYSGPISTWTSADLEAANGVRSPSSDVAQKDFRTAWVMIHRPVGTPDAVAVDRVLNILNAWNDSWIVGTLGRGTMTNVLGASGGGGGGTCPLTYDVFLGEEGGPSQRVCTRVTEPACDPGPLPADTTYAWHVESTTPNGSVSGPTWRFTTSLPCRIVNSQPAHCTVDARQPHAPDTPWLPLGWNSVALEMDSDCDTSTFVASDFTVSVPSGPAPEITAISVSGNNLTLQLSNPIPARQWTCVTHDASGQRVCLGYLPGDVNGDGTSGPADILALIDSLNGVAPRPDYATDTDRSGTAGPEDILREIDLLNGAALFDVWLDATLGPCPN